MYTITVNGKPYTLVQISLCPESRVQSAFLSSLSKCLYPLRKFLKNYLQLLLTRSLFLLKNVFGPCTAKSQPIYIKFCTHLLLYGIHLCADIDRDRRVGGSRPNQNDYVFLPARRSKRCLCYGKVAGWLSVTAGIMSKRLNLSYFFDHLVAPS